ncbi:hypothetical protein [Sandaracinus amylolyticus]|nr:hypothetical protein [Sandaracinus amylolyticus]
MRWSGVMIVVALGLAACEAPVREQSGYLSEGAQDELTSERQEQRMDEAREHAEDRPSMPEEQRTPDLWHGPEDALGAGGSPHEELAPPED